MNRDELFKLIEDYLEDIKINKKGGKRFERNREELLDKIVVHFLGLDFEISKNIKDKGFCKSPASIGYHGKYTGALFDHSLIVVLELMKMTKALNLNWVNREKSPVIVGLFHDLCKIDLYEKIINVQEDLPIEWSKASTKSMVHGHGSKSVIIANLMEIPLTEEETICILHHMGPYETKIWDNYEEAVKKYPNVLYVHTADMLAAKIWGV